MSSSLSFLLNTFTWWRMVASIFYILFLFLIQYSKESPVFIWTTYYIMCGYTLFIIYNVTKNIFQNPQNVPHAITPQIKNYIFFFFLNIGILLLAKTFIIHYTTNSKRDETPKTSFYTNLITNAYHMLMFGLVVELFLISTLINDRNIYYYYNIPSMIQNMNPLLNQDPHHQQ